MNICSYLIDPCASSVSLTFSDFLLSSGDYLRIYDGTDNSGIPLWNVSAYGSNGITGDMYNSNFDTTYTASTSGKMFIEFQTNSYGTSRGFIGEWSSVPGNFTKPTATFTSEDTVCVNMPLYFENNSSGDYLDYVWDFDITDGFNDVYDRDVVHTYENAGIYTVRLIISNCGGMDTFTKNVHVINPTQVPAHGFYADILYPTLGTDVVKFHDTSAT